MARRLRIAVSVFFALVAVAFFLLWARSYWWRDGIVIPIPGPNELIAESVRGGLHLHAFPCKPGLKWIPYRLDDIPNEYNPDLPTVGWVDLGVLGSTERFYLLPHSLAVLIATLLSIAVATIQIQWPKQFSIRTMLIATTLIAVVLGLAMWASR